ncbi:hypothetical protein IE4803_CH04259 [Rhizobium etli bv. phaseoli str. IE4803]|uniref:Uncharacterized protein n=1 Tax=Rhizobium etli bv. mimosae str. IE4771 TaxID=1432050 RepID=A0A060IB07_RHIET|nr:hypothetical protein IE4771_CH04201 [Rhizobium sp. IE4771]AJC81396.1 hypothetical protein IE4803_CH04259 [Rhizobium etli bv. phaseoli str. IE4803]
MNLSGNLCGQSFVRQPFLKVTGDRGETVAIRIPREMHRPVFAVPIPSICGHGLAR